MARGRGARGLGSSGSEVLRMRASRTTRRGFLAQGAGRLPVLLFQRKAVMFGMVSLFGGKKAAISNIGRFLKKRRCTPAVFFGKRVSGVHVFLVIPFQY